MSIFDLVHAYRCSLSYYTQQINVHNYHGENVFPGGVVFPGQTIMFQTSEINVVEGDGAVLVPITVFDTFQEDTLM